MAYAEALKQIALGYERQNGRTTFDDLRAQAGNYIKARNVSILDAAAIGFAFDVIFSEPTFDIAKITPEMASAWSLAYPNVPIESLAGRSTEELAGAISGWKGKLFEVQVEKRLNNGEWVGDLHLEPGQHAALAESVTQPGWDMQIFEGDGTVVDAIQLKATQSVSYVHHALERYPDTPILATHEVALRLADNGAVIDSGIPNELLTESVSDHLSDATSDAVSDSLMGAMPLSIIVITEATKVLAGTKSFDEALSSGGDRLAKGAVAGAVATVVSVVATPFFGAIAGFLTRLALGGESGNTTIRQTLPTLPNLSKMYQTTSQLKEYAESVEPYYPCPPRQEIHPLINPLTDKQELLLYVDQDMRLSVLRGAMPLETWIMYMSVIDTSRMAKEELEQHISDLENIRNKRLISQVFPDPSWPSSIWKGSSEEGKELRKGLNQGLQTANLYLKKILGTLTPDESVELDILSLPTHEQPLAREKLAQANREKRLKEIQELVNRNR